MEKLIEKAFSPEINDYVFHSFYQKKVLKDYEASETEFVNYYKRLKGVIAIYRYGNVSILGISDLDYIVVFNDNYRHRFGSRYDITYFSKETQYLLNHPQNFLCKTVMKDVKLYYDPSNLKKIWGELIDFNSYDEQYVRNIQLLHWLDFLIFVSPKSLIKFFLSKNINVRMAVSKLKAIKFCTAALCHLKGADNLLYSQFNQSIEQLRCEWFDREKQDNLNQVIMLMKKGIEIGYKLIAEYNDLLKTHPEFYSDTYLSSIKETICFKSLKNTYLFIKQWNAEDSFNETLDRYLKSNEYLQILPLNFVHYLLQYCMDNGRFGEIVRKGFGMNPDFNLAFQNNLALQRAKLINRHIQFIEGSKITDTLSFNLHHYGYRFYCNRRRGEYRYSHIQRWMRRQQW